MSADKKDKKNAWDRVKENFTADVDVGMVVDNDKKNSSNNNDSNDDVMCFVRLPILFLPLSLKKMQF